MIKAKLYSSLKTKSLAVQCYLCPHSCIIHEGQFGICKTRQNSGGVLYANNFGKLVTARADPIEKKPLYHFYPGHSSFSISSVGCNLSCLNCQNSSISQQHIQNIHVEKYSPEQVVERAFKANCKSIAYTYTEPTTLLEFILATAPLAQQYHIHNVLVSNGYMSNQCIDMLIPQIQAINIDLKSFSDTFYKKICKATLSPILNTIKQFFKAGIHVEITTLLIPELNDTIEELTQICSFIHSIHPEIPWHISRFHPSYKLQNKSITPLQSLMKALEIGQKQGLKHIYIGNTPEINTHTHCQHCATLLITRNNYNTTLQNLDDGYCTECGTRLFGAFT